MTPLIANLPSILFINLFVAIAAASAAAHSRNAWFGIVASLGGGALRDMLCLQKLPTSLQSPDVLASAIVGALLGVALGERPGRKDLLDFLDEVGIGVFLAVGLQAAAARFGLASPAATAAALLTALGGGALATWTKGRVAPVLTNGKTIVLCAAATLLVQEWTVSPTIAMVLLPMGALVSALISREATRLYLRRLLHGRGN